MKEVKVHAANADEALADGAAALGVSPRQAQVEILAEDEDGVTALVTVPDEAQAESAETAGDGDSLDEVCARARRSLQTVLELMGMEARCEVQSANEDEIVLNILGEDLGIVIGSCGQTLNALQFLLNLMVNKGGRRRRLTVDAEGYRDRRRQRLEELAGEHARRAKAERRPVILEGLRAAERRIIHTALQHDPDIVTYSEGEEPHRRLIITPRS
ncbi:MAG: KH domain-containing protein [Armatimonadetes bacterium]|nr:KH domain-containing protein [Armatimonadota bacterium]